MDIDIQFDAQTYAQLTKNKINDLYPLPPIPVETSSPKLFDFDKVKRSPTELKHIEESKDLIYFFMLYIYFGAWAAIYYFSLKYGGGGPIF